MSAFKRISIEQAQPLLAQDDVAVVDVRDAQSYNTAHIDGAFLLDNNTVDQFIDSTDKTSTVVVYCYHGNSSQNAAQFLVERGFSDVYSLDGGYELWKQSN
ncbi:MAG: thiosulfate sulfurtransferase [Oceanicoccus sp.]|jgi:thiosulfate sulfurtransferase